MLSNFLPDTPTIRAQKMASDFRLALVAVHERRCGTPHASAWHVGIERGFDREPDRPLRRRSLFSAGAFAILAMLATFGPAVGMAAETPPAVSVVTAHTDDLIDRIHVVGSLVAREEAIVKVDLDDLRIVSVDAEIGDVVRKGDVLARTDPTRIDIEESGNAARLLRADAAIAQAKSQIGDAELAYEQARMEAERSRKLRARGFAADETLAALDTRMKRAASALELMRRSLDVVDADRQIIVAERRDIETRLARTVIKAPTDGRILRRTAKVGALTATGGEPLFVLAQDGEIELDAEVPEADFARLAVGQVVGVSLLGRTKPAEGRVRLMAPELRGGSRLGHARIAVESVDGLPVGAFARGEIEVGRSRGIVLPASAVLSAGGDAAVQVVDDGTVVVRPVETGLRTSGLVEIRTGLVAGELVVLRAGNFLVGGDRVHAVQTTYPGSDAPEDPILTSDVAR